MEGEAKEDGRGVSSFSWVEGEDYSSLLEGLLSQPPLVSRETSELSGVLGGTFLSTS